MAINSRIFEELREYEQQAINGEVSPFEVYVELYDLSKSVETMIENIKESAVNQVDKEPNKQGLISKGYTAIVQQKTTWKFDHIKKWKKEKEKLAEIERQAKEAYIVGSTMNVNTEFDNGGVSGNILTSNTKGIEPAIREMSKPFIKLDKLK